MLEWLLLVCLVPLVVVSIVFLFGFAGCDLVFKLTPPLPLPGDVTATATGIDTIRLTWTKPEGVERVKVVRTSEGDTAVTIVEVVETSFDDTGLDEATTYFYELSSLGGGRQSAPVATQASTLAFLPVFAAVLTNAQTGQGGKCVVQRIEPVRLANSGTRVRITVAAPAAAGVVLDLVTISKAADAAYDSAPDLATVATTVFVAAGTSVVLPIVDYALDKNVPLLVAFDVSAPGALAFLPNVPAVEASAFVGDMHAAAQADRPSGFTPRDRIFLIEKIEAV